MEGTFLIEMIVLCKAAAKAQVRHPHNYVCLLLANLQTAKTIFKIEEYWEPKPIHEYPIPLPRIF